MRATEGEREKMYEQEGWKEKRANTVVMLVEGRVDKENGRGALCEPRG